MGNTSKPDRLERAVDALIDQAEDSYLHRDILALLRREQRAQRARVTRIIKAHRRQAARERVSYYGLTIDCCNDLLAKLHGRTP